MSAPVSPGAARPPSGFVAGGIVLAAAIAWTGLAFHRPMDGDDGLYHYAALRVAGGAIPYRDFCYAQLPYLIYPYALLGSSYLATRFFSVALVVGALAIFARLVRNRGVGGTLALLLLALNVQLLVWMPCLKTYSMTILLSVGAFLLVQDPTPRRALWAGLCLGALVSTRLLYAPFPLIFAVALAFPAAGRGRRLLCFGAGLLIASIPCLVLALLSPSNFLANVIGHHMIRSTHGAVGNSGQKAEVLETLLLRPQWILLLGLAVVGLARSRTPAQWLALGCAASLAAMSFLPTPCYEQYFVCVVPFVVYLAVPALEGALGRAGWGPVAVLLAIYVAAVPQGYRDQLGDIPSHDLRAVETVARAIQERARPGEEVLSFWAGYAAITRTRVPPGLDSCCQYDYSQDRMSAEMRRAIGVPGRAEVEAWIRERRYALVQVGGYAQSTEEAQRLRHLLSEAGYATVLTSFDRTVHERR